MRTQPLLYLGAAACFLLAAVLIFATGLPDRASFTGFYVPNTADQTAQFVAPEPDALAPPINTQTLDGRTITLDDLSGHPVVVNFWATWCIPCRVEMPELQHLHETHPQVHVLAVNLAEQPQDVTNWVETFGLTFAILLDADGTIATDYRIGVQPSTFVISPEGIIEHVFYGPVTQAQLQAVLAPYL